MKKIKKGMLILIILLILFFLFANKTYAIEVFEDVLEDTSDLFHRGFFGWYMQDDTAIDIDIRPIRGTNEFNGFIGKIVGYLQVIGSVISIVALVIIGFRYMFSSLEEKAQMKGILIYYVVGAILVFATSNVISIVYKVISGLTM